MSLTFPMFLAPVKIGSPLSKAECVRRLKEEVGSPLNPHSLWDGLLRGCVSSDAIQVRLENEEGWLRGAYGTIVDARITEHEQGSILKCRFSSDPRAFVIGVGILGFVLTDKTAIFGDKAMIVATMLVMWWLIASGFGRARQRDSIIRILSVCLEASRLDSQAPVAAA